MKGLAFFTGFLLLTTAVAVPLIWRNRTGSARKESEDNTRYDIDDYVATEWL